MERSAWGATARPSTSGVCAIAQASSGWSAATRKRWPPASEKPQTEILSGSTSGRPDAYSIAACQSATCSSKLTIWRGAPPLSPNRRWSKARTAKPASLNRAANWSEAGSFVTEVPPAMITQPPLDPG